MKPKQIIYGLLAIVLGALIFYRINSNSKVNAPKNTEKVLNTTSVKGMILKPQKFNNNILLSGTLEANEQIEIRSEVPGIIKSINFKEGAKVSQGQVLFSVDDIELQAQLSKAKTAQKLAEENERRAQLLLNKQAISQEEYDIASADYQSASAESSLIAAQLSKTVIRAPFSGTIGLRSISLGTYVTQVTPVAKLINTDKLKITFSIPEKYSSLIKIGSELMFTTSNSNEKYTATIYAMEPEVEIATRTLKMRAVADNPNGDLLPGTYANVVLPLETINDALLVPSEALIPVQNGKKIFITENGIAKEIDIEIGSRTGSSVRVLSGLQAGDTVLTYGVMALKNGVPVTIKLEDNLNISTE